MSPARASRRARGLCLNCELPAAPDRSMCDFHLKKNVENAIKNRRKRRALGTYVRWERGQSPKTWKITPGGNEKWRALADR